MRRREAETQVNAPLPAPARRVPAIPSTHPVRLSAALHPASTSQAGAHMQLGKGGRKKRARIMQVHSMQRCWFFFVFFKASLSDWQEEVIRCWPFPGSVRWPTAQIKGKLGTQGAKYSSSFPCCASKPPTLSLPHCSLRYTLFYTPNIKVLHNTVWSLVCFTRSTVFLRSFLFMAMLHILLSGNNRARGSNNAGFSRNAKWPLMLIWCSD